MDITNMDTEVVEGKIRELKDEVTELTIGLLDRKERQRVIPPGFRPEQIDPRTGNPFPGEIPVGPQIHPLQSAPCVGAISGNSLLWGGEPPAVCLPGRHTHSNRAG